MRIFKNRFPCIVIHIQIADLRDNIETMSGFLIETNATYDNLVTMMDMVSSDTDLNSAHGNVLKELHEKLVERKRVFVKRSTEMARKQAWYRSVALGTHRRDLLCWMLNAVIRTLSVISRLIFVLPRMLAGSIKCLIYISELSERGKFIHICA